jgi:hypothetical protein
VLRLKEEMLQVRRELKELRRMRWTHVILQED